MVMNSYSLDNSFKKFLKVFVEYARSSMHTFVRNKKVKVNFDVNVT